MGFVGMECLSVLIRIISSFIQVNCNWVVTESVHVLILRTSLSIITP